MFSSKKGDSLTLCQLSPFPVYFHLSGGYLSLHSEIVQHVTNQYKIIVNLRLV